MGHPTGRGSRRERSILLVAYFYPPTRDTGARRPAALAKHLSRLGHSVTVLTTGAFGVPTSGDDGEGGPRVIRTADAQRLRAWLGGRRQVDSLFDSDTYSGRPHPLSRVLVPEPLVAAWAPFARRAGLRAHRATPFDAVITSSPPESAHLLGRALRRRGAAWVADVRDAWTFEPLRPAFPLAAQRSLDRLLERRWIGGADAVVCVSEPAAADLRERGIADPVLIPNAWDPDHEPSAAAVEASRTLLDPERLSLLYTGRFGSYGRDPRGLVEGVAELARTAPEMAAGLELAIAGPLTPDERELVGRDLTPAKITLLGSVEAERALALQRCADALLLLALPARSQLVNFKLFEYLAAGRPILALCAGTEAGRLLAETGAGPIVAADDPHEIANALRMLLAGRITPPDPSAAARHSYPAAAGAMADAVEQAIAMRSQAGASH